MNTQGVKRKLTTILSADVKWYSRLMGEDEEWTVRILKAYKDLMGNLIQQHRGRVVDAIGDNLMAEFASVVDAVQCGVEIQQALRAKNALLPETRRVEFRIGINLGDVIEDGERIYGDGVNIAARLEGLAEPGGICISESVYQQIENKLPLKYKFLGEHKFKNIAKPMRVYRAQIEPEAASDKMAKPRQWQKSTIGLVVVFIIVGAAFVIWKLYTPPTPKMNVASIEKMAFPLPDKPSIAVLPFTNMSGDLKQEYFSDGITEEIITALSRVPRLFVIARNSTFTYKGKPVKVQQVSEELGVRYILEGSVRKDGDKIRITAQLIDALTGNNLWAERYDRNVKDIFAVQDEITKKIITAMQVQLTQGEQARAVATGTNNLEAYLKFLQARELAGRQNPESNALAKQLAEETIALDPTFVGAYTTLAFIHQGDCLLGTSKSPKDSLDESIKLLQKAIILDNTYAEAHCLLGWIFLIQGQHNKAVAEGEKAVALNPNSAESHMILGKILTFAGRYEESIPELKTAIRLNPIPPNLYLYSLGISYALTGHLDEAMAWCEKAVRQEPNSMPAHLFMAAFYSRAGRDKEAQIEAAEVLRINPQFSLEKFANTVTYKNPENAERTINAPLRKVGLK